VAVLVADGRWTLLVARMAAASQPRGCLAHVARAPRLLNYQRQFGYQKAGRQDRAKATFGRVQTVSQEDSAKSPSGVSRSEACNPFARVFANEHSGEVVTLVADLWN